jgi:hypothetical protein
MFVAPLLNDEITLFDRFPTQAMVMLSTPAHDLCLRSLKKSVISYRIGHEPSNHAGFSQYTYLKKTYRQYVFTPYVARGNDNAGSITTLNTEV